MRPQARKPFVRGALLTLAAVGAAMWILDELGPEPASVREPLYLFTGIPRGDHPEFYRERLYRNYADSLYDWMEAGSDVDEYGEYLAEAKRRTDRECSLILGPPRSFRIELGTAEWLYLLGPSALYLVGTVAALLEGRTR